MNKIEHVMKTLEKVCSSPAPEAYTTTMSVHNEGWALVFETRTEDEALGVTSKLQQAGLKSEIRNRAQDLVED